MGTALDLDFVRSQFPAFAQPSLMAKLIEALDVILS
jgi:hypothetical protein